MVRKIAVAAGVAGLVVLPAPPARAQCASPPPLEEAIAANEAVFVGTVVDVSVDNVATVRVESVWKGPKLAAEVPVFGGSITVPTNRAFDENERYLFLPLDASPPFEDNRCTSTQPYRDELDRFRPAGAHERPTDVEGKNNALWTVSVLVILVGLLVVQVLRTGRKTRATRWEHAADEARKDPPG